MKRPKWQNGTIHIWSGSINILSGTIHMFLSIVPLDLQKMHILIFSQKILKMNLPMTAAASPPLFISPTTFFYQRFSHALFSPNAFQSPLFNHHKLSTAFPKPLSLTVVSAIRCVVSGGGAKPPPLATHIHIHIHIYININIPN